jgi:hypothetical protein
MGKLQTIVNQCSNSRFKGALMAGFFFKNALE